MMHSSTTAASMPARRTASRTTIAPRSGALKSFSPPRNLPVGVRTALTITASRTYSLLGRSRGLRPRRRGSVLNDDAPDDVRAEELVETLGDHRTRVVDLALPGGVPRPDAQRAVVGPHAVRHAAER